MYWRPREAIEPSARDAKIYKRSLMEEEKETDIPGREDTRRHQSFILKDSMYHSVRAIWRIYASMLLCPGHYT